jgi:hypothetical protein
MTNGRGSRLPSRSASVHKPPAAVEYRGGAPVIFLAGSIEMGVAEDWQTEMTAALADLDVVVLNPRRDDWDASWTQSITDDNFRGQVEWELAGMERADVIAMYFAPSTRAPITLLELGLWARSGKVVVGCPDGFWRKGNVEVVARRYGVPLHASLEALTAAVRARLAGK